jgi:hypothetical protein
MTIFPVTEKTRASGAVPEVPGFFFRTAQRSERLLYDPINVPSMPEPNKKLSQYENKDTDGTHGGNRAGGKKEDKRQPDRDQQAAGKDPNRGKSQ